MTVPTVLFACIHNSGRSVLGQALLSKHAAGRVRALSAGSEPGDGVNAAVAAVLAEEGIDVTAHSATLLTYDGVGEADVIITMGCGESCPVSPGKRYEDWELPDPKGQDLAMVRELRDEIERRVLALLTDLLPTAPTGGGPSGP
jgi:arsenate reductase